MKLRKRFITAEQLYKDAYLLADKVLKSGYKPDALLVIWRGGSPVGIVVHEYLVYHGIEMSHAVVKAQSYTGIATRTRPVIEDMTPILKQIRRKSRILIVDDLLDTGSTMSALKKQLKTKDCRIKTAAIYRKKTTPRKSLPDFYVRVTNSWIVFPHELCGLSASEIRRKSAHLHKLINTKP